jgi:hypothetical protein
MTSASSPGWRNARILLTLLVVFLCGASAGMVVLRVAQHNWTRSQSQPAWKEGGKQASLDHFRKELNLTPAQTEQLETILDDFFTYYHTLQAQLDDVRLSGRQRILRILDDGQKKKFEKLMNEMQEKQLR